MPFKQIAFLRKRGASRETYKENSDMADTDLVDATLTIPQREAEKSPAPQGIKRWLAWHRLALMGITLVSIFMNFYQLGANGYSSYYPAAIRSMMDSWHNFFFAAYDPGGFVTIDKPPVGFWLEVASARIFGFNSVSILLPQALAGVLAVLLLYHLVRRHFGVVASLLAALPAGRTQEHLEPPRAPGDSGGSAAGDLAFLGGSRRPRPGVAKTLC